MDAASHLARRRLVVEHGGRLKFVLTLGERDANRKARKLSLGVQQFFRKLIDAERDVNLFGGRWR